MLGFLCACVLIVSYLAAGIALSLLIDGIAPTFDLWNSETISFNGVALCTAMIYFEILPYVSTSFDNRVPTNGFPFNMRASPDAIALWTASILGTVQATVVLIM